MAKRKRLTPARHAEAAPETNSISPTRGPLVGGRPPIADVAGDAAASSALRELSDAMNEARDAGRIIRTVALDAVVDDHLMRDRLASAVDRAEMDTLIDSLKTRGQQVAIEVTELEGEMFGLISGWRRLAALREMSATDPSVDTVLAIVRKPDDASEAYQAMVEENEIRVGLSFYERARIVVKSVEEGVFRVDRVALTKLFGAVTKSKRSKINAFIPIVRTLDGALPFPAALSEKQGLALAKALDSDDTLAERLIDGMEHVAPKSAAEQTLLISQYMRPADAESNRVAQKEIHQIRDGLKMTVHAGGRVVLEGERMTEAHFLRRLKEALDNL